MNLQQVLTMHDCARGSLLGEMTFPQVVGRLIEIGVERYHTDYCRQETTYYTTGGESTVVDTPFGKHPIPTEFSAVAVEAAVRQSQRNEHNYLDFVRKTAAAGCVGYFVQIAGRRAMYFGRGGEVHLELFPPTS